MTSDAGGSATDPPGFRYRAGGGVHGPVVFGVAAGHVLANLWPGATPEGGQVGGDLDGPAGGGEDLNGQGDVAAGDSRVDSGAIQVLGARRDAGPVAAVVDG